MVHSNDLITMLGLAALVSPSHAYVPAKRGSAFSVDVIAAPALGPFNPEAELQRLQTKFPTTGSLATRQSEDSKQAGSAPVTPSENGYSWFVPTVVGNQTFNMIYDTGSADMWMYSNESSPYQSLEHPTYVPTSSATLLPNYTWSIAYAYGQAIDGVVFTDIVKAGEVTFTNQSVQSAVHIPIEVSSDGIMGLAFSTINTVQPVKQKTFYENLAPTLQKKVFSANLRLGGGASWDFGYIDDSKYSGDIAYVPVVSEKYWSVAVNEYGFGEGSFGNETIGDVIVDSGTSLIYLPNAVVAEYYGQIEGYELTDGGSHIFPCNSTVPDLHFKIEGATLSVPGHGFNLGQYDPGSDTCVGALNTQLNMKYSVLGNLFMQNYYVVHSTEEETPRMGFAPMK